MGWTAKDQHENESINELRKLSDRAAAIVAASLVEVRLVSALKHSFKHHGDVEKDMFRSSQPLGSFSARIKLAYLLGILTERAYNDLDLFKDIRNKFAHRIDVRNFKTQQIKDLCNNLRLIEIHFQENRNRRKLANPHNVDIVMGIANRKAKLKDPRRRYMMTAMLFTEALLYDRGNKPRL